MIRALVKISMIKIVSFRQSRDFSLLKCLIFKSYRRNIASFSRDSISNVSFAALTPYKMNKVVTLGQFIIERQADFPYAKGELSRLLRDIGSLQRSLTVKSTRLVWPIF